MVKNRVGALGSWLLALVVVVLAAAPSAPLDHLEQLSQDWRFRLRGPRASSARIVLVEVDERTLDAWPEPMALFSGHLAELIDRAHRANAKAIGVDFIPTFKEDDFYRALMGFNAPTPEIDLENAVDQTAGAVCLARKVDVLPREGLLEVPGVGTGCVDLPASADGVVRELFSGIRDDRSNQVVSGFIPAYIGIKAPKAGSFIVNYVGRPFYRVSAVDFAKGAFDPKKVDGAFVLIGSNYLGSNDVQTTPLEGSSPGVEILANGAATLLDGRPIVASAPVWRAAIDLVCATFALIAGWQLNVFRGLALVAAVAVAYTGSAIWLFSHADRVLPLAAPWLIFAVLFPITAGFRGFRESWLKARMKASFGALVSNDVLDHLLKLDLGYSAPQERFHSAIMFLDIRGFTTMSENYESGALVDLLNRLFSRLSERIEAEGGYISTYLGDGFYAVFGGIRPLENPSRAAVDAASGIFSELKEFNATEKLVAGMPPWRLAIGIHYGEVLAGFVGSENRHQYTLIGDPVNTASRIDDVAKQRDLDLAISADCYEQAGVEEDFGVPFRVAVKGKAEDIECYGRNFG